jgi:hypothetical protein
MTAGAFVTMPATPRTHSRRAAVGVSTVQTCIGQRRAYSAANSLSAAFTAAPLGVHLRSSIA